MILAGHQPEYLPYIGFFNKFVLADKIVIVDHVQFKKKNFQNRNKIKTPQGSLWLTVPVITSGKYYQSIYDVEVSSSIDFRKKHLDCIYFNYQNTKYFKTHFPFFEGLYSGGELKLIDINMKIITYIFNLLEIDKKITFSSELEISGKKTDLLIELCDKLDCNSYLSGEGAVDYIDEDIFKNKNLKSLYRRYTPPKYHQINGDFIENLSIIDCLFNCGTEVTKDLVNNCGIIMSKKELIRGLH